MLGFIAACVFVGCDRPHALVVVPEHRDLGVANRESDIVVAEFDVLNGLDRPVEVKQLFPSCQCTKVALVTNPIPAGGSSRLRAEADVAGRPGKQEFSVVMLTDSSEFPTKRVSFAVVVPASGTRQRHFSLGSFSSGDDIDLRIPVTAFSQGVVDLQVTDNDLGFAIDMADQLNAPSISIQGKAPHRVGPFGATVRLQETLPNPSATADQGIIELELVGIVAPRWTVLPDTYAGFVRLDSNAKVKLAFSRNPASARSDMADARVSIMCDEEWLKVVDRFISSEQIEVNFTILAPVKSGPAMSPMSLTIQYNDNVLEEYRTDVYMYIEP